MFVFCVAVKLTEVLESLSNRPIKIFLASDSNSFISKRLDYFGDCPFELTNLNHLEYTASKFDSDALITKDGKFFYIAIGGTELCIQDDQVIGCIDKPDKWQIKKESIGFTFVYKKRCLTFYNRSITLEDCSNNDNQLFDFFLLPEVFHCLNDIPSKSTEEELLMRRVNDEIRSNAELKKIFEQKRPIKSMKDFIDKSFQKESDIRNGKKMIKLGKLFKWGKRPSFKFPSKNFIKFMCPS